MNKFNKLPGYIALAFSLLLLGTLQVQAADRDLSSVAPEDVGMSSEGLAKLSEGMAKAVDDGKIAGVVTMLARHGKIVHFDAYGHQDLENDVAMEKDTIFRIFSMTKPITGVALMMLYEQGKFQLSDAVEKYIPEFAGLKVAKEDGPDGMPVVEDQEHKMTIQELMSHTGGLTYGFFSQSQTDTLYNKAGVLTSTNLKQMIDRLALIPLRQQPGSLWHYSVSVDVQGYLVEVLSGKSFDVFLEENVFQPLGMKDTSFQVTAENASRLSRSYSPTKNGLRSPTNDRDLLPVTFFSGGGGLRSTAADYMKFAQMVANGGELNGVRIISSDSVDMMRTNKLPGGIDDILMFSGNQFGIDFAIVTDSEKNAGMSVGSYWWFGVQGTWFWIDPVEDLVMVGMIQNGNIGFSRQLHAISERLTYAAISHRHQQQH